MKPHQYMAIIVLLASAAWVLTGEFSSVGSAAEEETATVETSETTATSNTEGETVRALQSVSVAVVPSFDHSRTVRISGVTEPDKETQLTARAGGVIEELLVRQGQTVKEGDPLARIAPEGRDVQLRSAEQALAQATADFKAKEQLVARGTVAKLQLDAVRSAMLSAQSAVEMAKAEIDRLTITAAFDGVIDEVLVEEGGAVQSGTPVAKLISLNPIIGRGSVNESDLPVVSVGETASLRLVSGSTVEGTIRYISRVAQSATRTFEVEVEVANPDLSIPAGMTAELILRGAPVVATPVPRSIVTLDAKGNLGIRAVDSDNKVVFYPIDLVDDTGAALMLGGIPKDARIIVAGQNLVRDGDTVEPVQADQALVDKLVAEAMGKDNS